MALKRRLEDVLDALLAPIRARRRELAGDPGGIETLLRRERPALGTPQRTSSGMFAKSSRWTFRPSRSGTIRTVPSASRRMSAEILRTRSRPNSRLFGALYTALQR